jgi:hypothetical protein
MMEGAGQDAKIALQGFNAQGIGQMTFSDARGTAEQDVLVACDKGAGGQVLDEGTVDTWRGRKVQVPYIGEWQVCVRGGENLMTLTFLEDIVPRTHLFAMAYTRRSELAHIERLWVVHIERL